MKIAVVEGERRVAEPRLSGLSAECPDCGNAVIAKCGEHRVWHWAHRGPRDCDPWREPETEWHRAWKNQFPEGWQEISQTPKNGEKHRADVKTESGVVLEFQHSVLPRGERESRESFYQNMVWVVDGRSKQHRAQFFASLGAPFVYGKRRIFLVSTNESALLRDWAASRVPVYFDFGDSEPGDTPHLFNTPTLWRLNPGARNGRAYLSPIPKGVFLRVHLEGRPFEKKCTETIDRFVAVVDRALADYLMRQVPQSRPLIGFERHWARRERARPRL
jgi:competence protein CoiA